MDLRLYMHIEKLGSDEVEGILNGTVEVFTKLDGSSCGIYLNSDGEVACNSRKRPISVLDDNAGCASYVLNNDKFKKYLNKHPNHYLYGEWLIKNVINTYKDDAWKKVYIFDIWDGEKYLSYDEYVPLLEEFDIEYIPRIAKFDNPSDGDIMSCLDKSTFLQTLDTTAGEGVVCKNYAYNNKYGRITWAKVVRAEFRARKKVGNGKPSNVAENVEQYIIDNYCTNAFIEKESTKVLNDIGGAGNWDNKYIGRILNTVYHELIVECIWDIVKKLKNPTINFSMLNIMVVEKTKDVIKPLFKENGIILPF